MVTHFGDWLRKAIAAIPMDQVEFAAHAGIPRATLSKWLASPNPPIRPANVTRLARGLGIVPHELRAKLDEAAVYVADQKFRHPPQPPGVTARIPIAPGMYTLTRKKIISDGHIVSTVPDESATYFAALVGGNQGCALFAVCLSLDPATARIEPAHYVVELHGEDGDFIFCWLGEDGPSPNGTFIISAPLRQSDLMITKPLHRKQGHHVRRDQVKRLGKVVVFQQYNFVGVAVSGKPEQQ